VLFGTSNNDWRRELLTLPTTTTPTKLRTRPLAAKPDWRAQKPFVFFRTADFPHGLGNSAQAEVSKLNPKTGKSGKVRAMVTSGKKMTAKYGGTSEKILFIELMWRVRAAGNPTKTMIQRQEIHSPK
jgi:hypothetical protein